MDAGGSPSPLRESARAERGFRGKKSPAVGTGRERRPRKPWNLRRKARTRSRSPSGGTFCLTAGSSSANENQDGRGHSLVRKLEETFKGGTYKITSRNTVVTRSSSS